MSERFAASLFTLREWWEAPLTSNSHAAEGRGKARRPKSWKAVVFGGREADEPNEAAL
jgi:hypothetical protein